MSEQQRASQRSGDDGSDAQPSAAAGADDWLPTMSATDLFLEQEQLFGAIWDRAADAMVLSNAQGTVLLANPAYYQLYGYSAEQVIGHSFAVIFPAPERAAAIEQYTAAFRNAVPQSVYESAIRRADGTERFVESRIDFLTRDGARTAMLSIIRDITERKQIEFDLRDQAETMEAIHQLSQMISAELDMQSLVQAVTNAATALSGAAFGAFFYNLTDEQGERYTLYTLAGVARDAFEQFPMPRNTDIFGPTFHGEGAIRVANIQADPRYGHTPPYFGMPVGHLPVVSYMAVPVISRTGTVLGGLFFGHPIAGVFTERAERLVSGLAAQTAIAMDNAHLLREAQAAVRLRDQFLSIASHELRTPTTALYGYVQLLQRRAATALSARDQHALDVVAAQTVRLNKLIATLLDISRIDQGQLQLDRMPLDLVALVERVATELQLTLEHHTLTYHRPSQPLWIDGDELRLDQVLQNLIDNAIKYSPAGGSITIGMSEVAGSACVTVADQGMGIPASALPRLFDRFYRAENVDDHHISGVGIGLYVVKEIVTLHGGSIDVVSSEGSGSIFTICLPLSG